MNTEQTEKDLKDAARQALDLLSKHFEATEQPEKMYLVNRAIHIIWELK